MKCPICDGTGIKGWSPCTMCNGTGSLLNNISFVGTLLLAGLIVMSILYAVIL